MSITMPATLNLAAHVLATGARTPDKTALVVVGEGTQVVLTYRALSDAVMQVAGAFVARGLAPGARILMRVGNTPDFPITYLAAIAAGYVPAPTSTQLTEPEITKIADQLQPALVVTSPDIALPAQPIPQAPATNLRRTTTPPLDNYAMGDPHRPAYIIYTSGTSGQSRAVVHAHRAILARQMMFEGWYGLRPDDRLLHAGAFNWTYTLGTGLMDPWTLGATAYVLAEGTDVAAIPALLAQHQISIFAAAPGAYRRILRRNVPPLPDLRHGLSAGEKLPEDTRRSWTAMTGTPIYEAYGMSECSTFISGSPARPAPPGTLGYPQPDRQITLIGSDGSSTGVIAVRRDDPGLMLGYLDQPDETAARMDGNWFLTGDIGTRGPDGAIAYAGRNDDMMNAGGTRVSPIEVEAALSTYPGLTEIACAEVRVRSDLSLIAAFYTAPDVLDEARMTAHAKAILAGYKIPRIFVHVNALPRGPNHKLLRRKLRIDWEAAHGQA